MKRLVIKPGAAEFKPTGSKMDGFDVTRHILDTLVSKGLATTDDCCTYTLVGGGSLGAIAAQRFLANSSGSSAVPTATTPTVATSMLDAMTAATTTTAGLKGLAPAAPIDSQNKFLKGNATYGPAIPAWADATVYEVGDIIYSSNLIYRCTTAHTSSGSFNASNFTELSASSGGSGLTLAQVAFTSADANSIAIAVYSGSSAPTLTKTSASVWTIVVPSGTLLQSISIYAVTADNPGSVLTLNINSSSSLYNQGQSTLFYPQVSGVNLAGGYPASYNPDTGAGVLGIAVAAAPTSGDVQITISNYSTALGSGASSLKLIF